jgi:hypothetical protein
MNKKLTSSGWLALFILVAGLYETGLLFKVVVIVFSIKIMWAIFKYDWCAADTIKKPREKVKLPAPLAEKLAKRNKT